MTRKDYLNIAAAIRATNERIENSTAAAVWAHEQLYGVRRAAEHIADALKTDNPANFDVQLFLENCGYGASKQPEVRPHPAYDA